MRRLRGVITGGLSFAYLILVLNPIQMLSALLYPFSRPLCRRINRWCARSIWGLWVILAEKQNGLHIRFFGDAIHPRENALVLPNHQSMADVLVVLAFAWRGARLGDTKWFVKDALKWIPGVGWGMKFLDCVFLKRAWDQDRASVERLFSKYQREAIPIFLVSFLEGTRRTPEKAAAARSFAEARGLHVPEHTLVPRTKGFSATIHGLRGHLDSVYDLSIAYGPRVPTLTDCFEAKVDRIDVHVRRFPIAEIPEDEAAQTEWVYARYREKDSLLAEHARAGRFAGPEVGGEIRAADWLRAESRVKIERPAST